MTDNSSFIDQMIVKANTEYPWTNSLGLFRSVLALSTLLTLIFNNVDLLSHKLYLGNAGNYIPGLEQIGLFTLLKNNLHVANLICIIILIVVILGFFPMITCILHWWVCFSISSGLTIIDGGEQASSVITFLLIPILVTDKRTSHWQTEIPKQSSHVRRTIANVGVWVVKFQICFIYFHSCISKLNVPEWTDGSVLHYWFTDSILGMSDCIYRYLGRFIDYNAYLIFIFTWGTLFLEFLISISIFFQDQKIRKKILYWGILFHSLIAISFGIISFSITMIAILCFYMLENKNYYQLLAKEKFLIPNRILFRLSKKYRENDSGKKYNTSLQ